MRLGGKVHERIKIITLLWIFRIEFIHFPPRCCEPRSIRYEEVENQVILSVQVHVHGAGR